LKTWGLWNESGIKTLDLVESNEGQIVWNYLEAPSARLYFEGNKERFEEDVFSNYLDVYSKTRVLAKENDNPDFLHNDPWLKNYLVDGEDVIPIDAGLKMREDLSVEELDVRLNRISLYSIANLDVNKSNKNKYVEMFRETLTDSEAKKVMDFNPSWPLALRAYLSVREEFVSRLKKRPKIDVNEMGNNFLKLKADFC
jgi:tRNA A-37 threonylcarbamoyl transferase component Bud32